MYPMLVVAASATEQSCSSFRTANRPRVTHSIFPSFSPWILFSSLSFFLSGFFNPPLCSQVHWFDGRAVLSNERFLSITFNHFWLEPGTNLNQEKYIAVCSFSPLPGAITQLPPAPLNSSINNRVSWRENLAILWPSFAHLVNILSLFIPSYPEL